LGVTSERKHFKLLRVTDLEPPLSVIERREFLETMKTEDED
jgi:hypothetical protein